MKSTNEVIEAVVEGLEVSEEELRYAVRNLSIWQNMLIFPLARAVTEEPLSPRTKRELERARESMHEGNKVPLDVRLKDGAFEPGVPREERTERFAKQTAETAVRLARTLTGGKDE